jgi:hypothetical protein
MYPVPVVQPSSVAGMRRATGSLGTMRRKQPPHRLQSAAAIPGAVENRASAHA